MTAIREFTPDEVAAAYRDVRQRVVEMLRSLPEESAEWPVPACPAWNVRALVSHLVGAPEDVLSGSLDGAPGDEWTNRQVVRHAADSLVDLATAYEATAAQFDAAMLNIPDPTNRQLVMDAFAHEQDLREAVNRPGARDVDAVEVALSFILGGMERHNPDLFAAVTSAPLARFDLHRALVGRVSVTTMSQWGLDGPAIAAYFSKGPLRPPA